MASTGLAITSQLLTHSEDTLQSKLSCPAAAAAAAATKWDREMVTMPVMSGSEPRLDEHTRILEIPIRL